MAKKYKILVLMKRFGTNKDMVLENFGRQVRLFESLKKYGYGIDFLCVDYTKKEHRNLKVKGIRYFVRPWHLLRPFYFLRELDRLIRREKYDIIVAATEPLLGIVGHLFSIKYGKRFIYDLQDHYACYDSYRIPFVSAMDRKAVKKADLVITVSETLKNEVKNIRKRTILTIPNGIDTRFLKRIGKQEARKRLGLPPKGKIIAYIGLIRGMKGARTMLDAFDRVRKEIPDAHLLLSGRVMDGIDINRKNVIFRALPVRKEVVQALYASDVALIPNEDNLFSRYCFPYKVMEYMACGLPIVATRVGDLEQLLQEYRDSLCEPSNAADMAEKLVAQLRNKRKVNYSSQLRELSWSRLAEKIHRQIQVW